MEQVRGKFLRLSVLLAFTGGILPLASGPQNQSENAEAAAQIKAAAEQLHRAYLSKNLDAMMLLWSAKSPHRNAIRTQAEKAFSPGSPAVIEHSLREPEIENTVARIRVLRESASAIRGASVAVMLVLEFRRERNEWRIWAEIPATDDLAARISDAATESERALLLSQNNDLEGAALVASLLSRGSDFRHAGKAVPALSLYEIAFSMAIRIGDHKGQALALSNFGLIHSERGEFQEALDWFLKSLNESELHGDDQGIARVLNNAGNIYSDIGDMAKAQDNYERSLAIAERLNNVLMMGNALGNLGVLSARRGDYMNSLASMAKAYRLGEKGDNYRGRTADLLNIGNVYLWQGDTAQAKDHFLKAFELAKQKDLRQLIPICQIGLGRVAQFNGDFPEAIRLLEASLNSLREIGDKVDESTVLTYLGDTYSWMGQPAEAAAFFQQGVSKQRDIGVVSELPLSLSRLAGAKLRAGDFTGSLKTAQEAIQTSELTGAREAVWRSQYVAGKAYLRMGMRTKAKAEFLRSVASIESLRLDAVGSEAQREKYFIDKVDPYHSLIELAIENRRTQEALVFAERAKARVLLDSFRGARPRLTALMTEEEQRTDQNFRMRLAAQNSRLLNKRRAMDAATQKVALSALDRTRLEYNAFEATLYSQHPDWKMQAGQTEPLPVQTMASLAATSNAAFVEFAATDEKLYILVLDSKPAAGEPNTHVRSFSVRISRKQLADKAAFFRNQMETRSPDFRKSGAELYQLLFAPLAHALPEKTRLVVIPDGALWEVPFEALPTPDGKYVIDHYTVSYAPSISALGLMTRLRKERTRAPARTAILAMGNPALTVPVRDRAQSVYRDSEFGPIPMAEKEVRDIGLLYGGTPNSHVYTGPNARESRFKAEASSARVIHLATHAVANNVSPLYSYLLLASERHDTANDGLLEAWELLRMNLHAELAVLSACNTAGGSVAPGEGVIGLSWALFVAGVPATVISQWAVQSDSTTDLMISFHGYRRNGLSDADALRSASLDVRSKPGYEHPFYWAPFIVVGAGLQPVPAHPVIASSSSAR